MSVEYPNYPAPTVDDQGRQLSYPHTTPVLATYSGWDAGDWMVAHVDDDVNVVLAGPGTLQFYVGWESTNGDLPTRQAINAALIGAGYAYVQDLIAAPGTPIFQGALPVPPASQFGDCQVVMHVLGNSIAPCGPGVVADWMTRTWTIAYGGTTTPDQLPPWPYEDDTGDGLAGPGPVGSVRRSRPAI